MDRMDHHEHLREFALAFSDGWENNISPPTSPICSIPAVAEAGQQASTAISEEATAVGEDQTRLHVSIMSIDRNGSCSGIGCDPCFQEASRHRVGVPTSGLSNPATHLLRCESDGESTGDAAGGGLDANNRAIGVGVHFNAPPLFSPPPAAALPPAAWRRPRAPQPLPHLSPFPAALHLMEYPEVAAASIGRAQRILDWNVAIGDTKNASGSANAAETNDVPKAIDGLEEEFLESWIRERPSQKRAEGGHAEAAAGSKDAAAPEDSAVVEGLRLQKNVMLGQSFAYEYFQRIQLHQRCTNVVPGADAMRIKHISAIYWLSHRDTTMPLDPNGVAVARFSKRNEEGVFFDANVNVLWRWPELVASVDDHTLLRYNDQGDYTPLQYIVNGPTWVVDRWHRTGIAACWIHGWFGHTNLCIQRVDGSCVILELNWENDRLRVYEFGDIDNSRWFDIMF